MQLFWPEKTKKKAWSLFLRTLQSFGLVCKQDDFDLEEEVLINNDSFKRISDLKKNVSQHCL
jgi:hypothetical protein